MFSVFCLKSKFLLYHVAYYPKKIEKYSQKNLAGSHPFFGKN